MALGLSEVVAKFDDAGEVTSYDLTGPFQTVQTTTPTPVATFTMPYDGGAIVTMQFNRGSNTSGSYIRGLAVDVGGSRIRAQLTNAANTNILSCYGDLPAGTASVLVNSGSNFSSGATTPTLIRIVIWRK